MDLEDAGCREGRLNCDRDSKSPGPLDTVLANAGIETVLTGVRMNAIIERWYRPASVNSSTGP